MANGTGNKSIWPDWETVRLIGRGSFGEVYEISRDVFGYRESAALKIITIPQNSSEIENLRSEGYNEESITNTFRGYLQNFINEYTLMSRLSGNANIVGCHDVKYVQHDDGIGWDIYIRMELLTPLMKAFPGDFSEDVVLRCGRDLCRALVSCEQKNIIHRDIKPQNIFISESGDFKLGDFGIAKVIEGTNTGSIAGTYRYMAPEVAKGTKYGSQADIYSLGMVLYWMLNSRRLPFIPLPPENPQAGDDERARNRRLSGEPLPAPLNGSNDLKRLVLKACAYRPEDRFQRAADMLRELSSIISSRSTEDLTSPTAKVSRKYCPTCGAEIGAGGRFCAVCGTDINTFSSPSAPRKKRPLIPAAISTLLAVAGIAVFLLLRTDKPSARSDQSPSASSSLSASVSEVHEHDWGDWTVKVPAGCESEGYEERVCTSDPSHKEERMIPATGHNWGEWTVEVQAGCETYGSEARTCLNDPSHKETRQIPPLGHDWSEATTTSPKTCRRCGKQEGARLTSLYETINARCLLLLVDPPKEYEMLESPVSRYVKGDNLSSSGGIYMRYMPDGIVFMKLDNHTHLNIFAVRGSWSSGYALAETDAGLLGWVRADLLSEKNNF